jgi:hypothetical protein
MRTNITDIEIFVYVVNVDDIRDVDDHFVPLVHRTIGNDDVHVVVENRHVVEPISLDDLENILPKYSI